ncbi:hypothetical protein GCM10023085_66510 [Actinomadura viridis]|uniref:Uncharacterized protein n=1 Tax=Actinomadura viridis TaxID=58110 RepID=A0A931GL02_9ACTN|nr:hypothetical protein [Actinomadura viridis]MBG6091473.1 hypothetical protein [Actinomadura viridis]
MTAPGNGGRDTAVPAEARERLGRVADALIHAGSGLPSGAEAGVHTALLDAVAKARPDLIPTLLDALDALGPEPGLAEVERLAERDPRLHGVLTLVVAGGYLMSPDVAARLRYPFQEAKIVDPRDIAAVVDEGLLDQVAERPPLYRLPPDAPPGLRA